jgi:YVTN family beta-propeller protein
MTLWRVTAACLLAGAFGLGVPQAASADDLLVANFSSDSVSVINTSTNAVVGPAIPVGDEPMAIAITPDGSRAYVANQGSDTVSVIDVPTRTTVGPPIPVPEVGAIAASPDGANIYVISGSFVRTIDTFTNTVDAVGLFDMTFPSGTLGIAVTPDEREVWVAHSSPNNQVNRIPTDSSGAGDPPKTNFLNTSFSGPRAIAFLPDGSRGYVASETGAGVIPIDASGTALGRIGLGDAARSIAISPNGSRAYIPSAGNQSDVYRIDLATNTVIQPTTILPAGPTNLNAVAITPDGSRVYVAGGPLPDPGKVVGLAVATGQPVGPPIDVGLTPVAMAIAPNLVPPTARLAQPAGAIAGLPVTFDASASSDPDGSVTRYRWNYGDGKAPVDAGSRPSHVFKSGTYNVRVTVTDNNGCSAAALYTGQTAYCRGFSGASASRTLVVRGMKLKATRRNRREGTATLLMQVPIGGDLKLRGPGLVRRHRTPGRAGIVPLKVQAKGSALRKLRRRGRLTVHPTITFRPRGGSAERKRFTVKLRRIRRSA